MSPLDFFESYVDFVWLWGFLSWIHFGRNQICNSVVQMLNWFFDCLDLERVHFLLHIVSFACCSTCPCLVSHFNDLSTMQYRVSPVPNHPRLPCVLTPPPRASREIVLSSCAVENINNVTSKCFVVETNLLNKIKCQRRNATVDKVTSANV